MLDPDGELVAAAAALSARGVDPYAPVQRRPGADQRDYGSAGICDLCPSAGQCPAGIRDVVAAVSLEALAASKDAIHPALARSNGAGVGKVIERLNQLLECSRVRPYKLQAAISLRIIPQVHGAHLDALDQVRSGIEQTIRTFSGNPMLVEDDGEGHARLLSVGSFTTSC